MIARSLRTFGSTAVSTLLRYRFHIVVDLAVLVAILALPLSLRSDVHAAQVAEPAPVAVIASGDVEPARAQTVSRGATITPAADPATRVADDVRPIVQYTLGSADTLESLGNFFQVPAAAIAASNGITDPSLKNQQGRTIMIPPGNGILYTVQQGDSLESVAAHFKVEPKVIADYNRLYFEPEHFAPQQLIFVPGAALPVLVYQVEDGERPTVISRPAPANNPSPNGRLAWPVAGYITQYFWALHTGVDMAAPYGTGIGAADDGTVVFEGYVAVGGLSVRIKHANGLETGYYHMSNTYVNVGDHVDRGEIIGTVGLTGVTTGPHVHWEVKLNGRFVNPLAY